MKRTTLALMLVVCVVTGCIFPVMHSPSDTIIYVDGLNIDSEKTTALGFTAPHISSISDETEDTHKITVNGYWYDKSRTSLGWYLFPMIPHYPSEPFRQLIFDFYHDQIPTRDGRQKAMINLIVRNLSKTNCATQHFTGNGWISIRWNESGFRIRLDQVNLASIDDQKYEIMIRGTIDGTATNETTDKIKSLKADAPLR